jgi:hypothetical protein
MKKNILWGMLALALAFSTVLVSCATRPAGALFGPNPAVSDSGASIAKTGTASGKVWLGLFGKVSYPTIEEAAKAGGITKVATVEYYSKLGIFGLWTDYTTIVTGE